MRKSPLAVAVAIMVIAIAPWIALWSSLPDEVATHWDLGGDPNGHMSRATALLVLGGVTVALALGALLQRKNVASPVLAFVSCVIAFASFSTALASQDESSWHSAHSSLVWVILGVAAAAGAAWVYAQDVEPPTTVAAGDRPVLAIRESERVAWVGAATSHWMRLTALALFVVGLVAFVALPEPAGAIVTLAAVVVAHVASVHVTITRHGVRTRGAFGWPGVTIATDRIESADPIDVNPWKWGGWGYRGSLIFMRRAAWVVHHGSGLHLVLKSGKEFVVTIDGAEEAAAVVNGLLATSTPR